MAILAYWESMKSFQMPAFENNAMPSKYFKCIDWIDM